MSPCQCEAHRRSVNCIVETLRWLSEGLDVIFTKHSYLVTGHRWLRGAGSKSALGMANATMKDGQREHPSR